MVTIMRNDYSTPTTAREDVIQAICEAFIEGGSWSTFHPISDGLHRPATIYVVGHKQDNRYIGFCENSNIFAKSIRIHPCEVREAFNVLTEHGYYMYEIYSYGTWLGYICSKKPYYEGGIRVTDIDKKYIF